MDINTIRDLTRLHQGMEISDHWKIVCIAVEESCSGIALAVDVVPVCQLSTAATGRWLIRTYSLYEAHQVLSEPTALRDRLGEMLQGYERDISGAGSNRAA